MSDSDLSVDLFCIGAPKCGTTWLARCLDEHPEASVSDPKEPNRYAPRTGFRRLPDDAYNRGMDWYRSCFQPAAVQADFSVNILHNGVEAIDRIRLDWPEARFLLVLRNPVERAYSQFWNARRNHPEAAVPRSFATALSIESFHLQSCYGRQLVPWLEAFPLDRFRFILDHALKNDPAAEVAGLYRWLGLDARWVPPSLEARVNVAHASGPLMRLAKRSAHGLRRHGGARVVRIATSLGLAALVRRMDRRDAVYPPLDPSDALLWWDSLEEDVRLLAEQTGVDVDPWRAQAEAWADAL